MIARFTAGLATLCLLSGPFRARAPNRPIRKSRTSPTRRDNSISTPPSRRCAKSKNKEVRGFAQDMVRDHTEVNKQALALVKKLNVKPEDNDTSRALTKQAAAKRAELAKLNGAAFDKAYVANEVAYHKTVNGALETHADPVGDECRTQEPAADRPEDLPGPPAACRARRR